VKKIHNACIRYLGGSCKAFIDSVLRTNPFSFSLRSQSTLRFIVYLLWLLLYLHCICDDLRLDVVVVVVVVVVIVVTVVEHSTPFVAVTTTHRLLCSLEM
jgi:hypothetical protein